jgi:hypothetical protein
LSEFVFNHNEIEIFSEFRNFLIVLMLNCINAVFSEDAIQAPLQRGIPGSINLDQENKKNPAEVI